MQMHPNPYSMIAIHNSFMYIRDLTCLIVSSHRILFSYFQFNSPILVSKTKPESETPFQPSSDTPNK